MKEMTLVEHLEELRTRIVRIVIILFVSFFITYHFGEDLIQILLNPLQKALGDNGKIVYLSIFDKIVVHFQVSFWTGIALSSPLWFREIWLFIRPGLYPEEVKVVRPFMVIGFFLFCAGVAFGYFVLFPFGFTLLNEFGVKNIEATISFADYVILVIKVLVCLGLIFQIPNILLILGFMELATKYSLAAWRKYVYVIFAVIAAVITPPDVVSMMLMWVPLIALYEIGVIGVALFVHPYLLKKYAANNDSLKNTEVL